MYTSSPAITILTDGAKESSKQDNQVLCRYRTLLPTMRHSMGESMTIKSVSKQIEAGIIGQLEVGGGHLNKLTKISEGPHK